MVGSIISIIRSAFTPREKEAKRATSYPRCPLGCGETTWIPRSRGEVTNFQGHNIVKQFFDCSICGVRCRLSRRVDNDFWTHGQTYLR